MREREVYKCYKYNLGFYAVVVDGFGCSVGHGGVDEVDGGDVVYINGLCCRSRKGSRRLLVVVSTVARRPDAEAEQLCQK